MENREAAELIARKNEERRGRKLVDPRSANAKDKGLEQMEIPPEVSLLCFFEILIQICWLGIYKFSICVPHLKILILCRFQEYNYKHSFQIHGDDAGSVKDESDKAKEVGEESIHQPDQQQQQQVGAQPDFPKFKGPQNDRQKAVVGAMKHAWGGYRKFAWGKDQLMPISEKSQEVSLKL